MELNHLRPSAVLLPLSDGPDGMDVILEVRSEKLAVQPGAICLPGGRLKYADGVPSETPREAAIRETAEELCLSRAKIEILGALPTVPAPDGSTVYPFAGRVLDYTDTFDRTETGGILRVPLAFFQGTEPEVYVVDLVTEPREDFPFERIPGGRGYPWTKKPYEMLFYQYEGQTIWGMTARVIRDYIRGQSDDTEDI